jgi:hypothetical protein
MFKLGSLFRKKKKFKKQLEASFRSDHYTRHNARRLEHLASLGLNLAGKTVIEFGAGIGDHSHYYIDRGCPITITEARPENIAYLKARYPEQGVFYLDLEKPEIDPKAAYQVVHCYGTLYHLVDPAQAIAFMAGINREILLLETCVSFGDGEAVNSVSEMQSNPTQAFSGRGCRPTRPWLFHELKKHYRHVYIPLTQPNHHEFPLDWSQPEKHQSKFSRSIFIASRSPIDSSLLSAELLNKQIRHP